MELFLTVRNIRISLSELENKVRENNYSSKILREFYLHLLDTLIEIARLIVKQEENEPLLAMLKNKMNRFNALLSGFSNDDTKAIEKIVIQLLHIIKEVTDVANKAKINEPLFAMLNDAMDHAKYMLKV